jgi:hypothetical protein
MSAIAYAERNIDLLHYLLREWASGDEKRRDAAIQDMFQAIPLIVQFLEEQQERVVELQGGVIGPDWPPVPFKIPPPPPPPEGKTINDPDSWNFGD